MSRTKMVIACIAGAALSFGLTWRGASLAFPPWTPDSSHVACGLLWCAGGYQDVDVSESRLDAAYHAAVWRNAALAFSEAGARALAPQCDQGVGRLRVFGCVLASGNGEPPPPAPPFL